MGHPKTKGEKNRVSTGLIGISRKYAVLLMTGVYGIRTAIWRESLEFMHFFKPIILEVTKK